MSSFIQRATAAAATALTLALTLSACGGAAGAADAARTDPDTLQILAGSEIQDMASVLEAATKETGVKVRFDYTGTLDGAQSVATGTADSRYDAVWLPSNRYLSLLPGATDKLASSTKIMQSPVILGVKSSVASRLGWDKNAPSWAGVEAAVAAGDFRYGMTSPAASNSGFSALVAVGTALADTGNSLTPADITKATPSLKSFFAGQKITAGSSGWLAEKAAQDPAAVDGLVNYESVLMGMAPDALGEPLTLVTPSDGVITADYPFSVLNAATDEKKAKADKLVQWLTTPEAQQAIMDATHRRPAVPGVTLASVFGTAPLVEQPFPNTLAVTNQLIDSYLSTIRRSAQTVFTLDKSGSMGGERIKGLRQALTNLTGADKTTTGSFASFQTRERVTLIPFSNEVSEPMRFTIPETGKDGELARIASAVAGLEAWGGTAIYDSLIVSYKEAAAQLAARPETFTSIVLMTDGESTSGAGYRDFVRYHEGLSPAAKKIPVFVIIFGEGNATELQSLAALTGGKAFDARKSDLSSVFREIRGYQ